MDRSQMQTHTDTNRQTQIDRQTADRRELAHGTSLLMALQIYPDRERRERLVYGYLDRLRLPAR